jgi:tRNA G10  N-methylase Trm11
MSNAFDQIFGNASAKMTPTPEATKPEIVAKNAPKVTPAKPVKKDPTPQKVELSNTQVLTQEPQKAIETAENEEIVEYIKVIKKPKKTPLTLGKGKTFFFEPDMMEFFKYVKFRKKMDESLYARQVFEKAFCEEFGDNWRDMIN